MIFGLKEGTGEQLSNQVSNLFVHLGEKPRHESLWLCVKWIAGKHRTVKSKLQSSCYTTEFIAPDRTKSKREDRGAAVAGGSQKKDQRWAGKTPLNFAKESSFQVMDHKMSFVDVCFGLFLIWFPELVWIVCSLGSLEVKRCKIPPLLYSLLLDSLWWTTALSLTVHWYFDVDIFYYHWECTYTC